MCVGYPTDLLGVPHREVFVELPQLLGAVIRLGAVKPAVTDSTRRVNERDSTRRVNLGDLPDQGKKLRVSNPIREPLRVCR